MASPGSDARPPRKARRTEIEERRERVQRLRLQGLSVVNIGKVLGVSAKTVTRDLKAVSEANEKTLDRATQLQFVAEAVQVFDETCQRAWAEFSAAPMGSPTRLRALDSIRQTTAQKLKALQDCGLISRDAPRLEAVTTPTTSWSPDDEDRLARALLDAALPTVLPEPVPDDDRHA